MAILQKIKQITKRFGFHPRAWLHTLLSGPRYLGIIRPALLSASNDEFLARRAALAKCWRPTKIKAPVGKKILALSPHPDDESIGGGGFLLSHRDSSEIHLLTVCRGDKGGSFQKGQGPVTEDGYDEMTRMRKEELAKSANMLNVKSTHFLDFSDGEIPATLEAATKIGDVIASINPDVIVLPWFLDNLSDHRMVNVLLAWGCKNLNCTVYAYEVWSLLYPNAFLDITPYIDEKVKLIQNYPSQLNTVDYVSYAQSLARMRAFQYPINEDRSGAVEAYMALPMMEYRDLVCDFYGSAGELKRPIANY